MKHIHHNYSYTRLYRIWLYIKQRCYNTNHNEYKSYGGRGIKMCDEWLHRPDLFCEWSYNNGYRDDLSIDRIDGNGDYSPDNCRWVTLEYNMKHHRNNMIIEHGGKTYESCRDFSKAIGVPNGTVRYWIKTDKLYERCKAKVIEK